MFPKKKKADTSMFMADKMEENMDGDPGEQPTKSSPFKDKDDSKKSSKKKKSKGKKNMFQSGGY